MCAVVGEAVEVGIHHGHHQSYILRAAHIKSCSATSAFEENETSEGDIDH